jgi:tetratricopeptide (TPR) repeat protein
MTSIWLAAQSGLSQRGWDLAGPDQTAERFALLQDTLERARGEYALRRYGAAQHVLAELLPTLRAQQPAMRSDETGRVLRGRYALLLASALCLLGRLRGRLNQYEDEQRAFRDSVELFAAHELDIKDRRSNSRYYTDYGIALFRIEQVCRAVTFLTMACDVGATPAEAFAYLGWAYNKQGQYEMAIEVLRKGLNLAPGDNVLLSVLAETLVRVDAKDEAVRAFCDAAVAAGQDQNLAEARRLLDNALNLDPTDPQAVSMATLQRLSQADEDGASDVLDRALSLSPDNRWARGLKGLVLYEKGRLTEAIELLSSIDVDSHEFAWVLVALAKAVNEQSSEDEEPFDLLQRAEALNPDDPQLLPLAAEIWAARDLDKAIELLRRAADRAPLSADIQHSLAKLLRRSGDDVGAAAAIAAALRIDPQFAPALVTRAEMLERQGKPRDALDHYRRAVRADPTDEAAFEALIDAVRRYGSTQEALDELAWKIELAPKNWEAYWKRGKILLDDNRPQDALVSLGKAADLNPDHVGVQLDLGRALVYLDDYVAAGEAFDRALALDDASLEALTWKAISLFNIADYSEAMKYLEGGLKAAPEDAFLHLILAWALQCAGVTTSVRVERLLRRATELDPNSEWSQTSLADFLIRTGRADEGTRILTELVSKIATSKGERNVPLIGLLGWCNYLLGQYDEARYTEALRLLQSCIAMSEDTINEHFNLALVLLVSGRSIARAEYDRAIGRAAQRPRLRQRKLFHEPLMDLIDAARNKRIGKESPLWTEAKDICQRIIGCLAEAGFDQERLVSLHDALRSLGLAPVRSARTAAKR